MTRATELLKKLTRAKNLVDDAVLEIIDLPYPTARSSDATIARYTLRQAQERLGEMVRTQYFAVHNKLPEDA